MIPLGHAGGSPAGFEGGSALLTCQSLAAGDTSGLHPLATREGMSSANSHVSLGEGPSLATPGCSFRSP